MDIDHWIILTTTFVFLISFYIFEFWRHKRNLEKIPIRIHVNGTRGKSSVARLIAAGLNAGGIKTCAKTTGALPRMIMPDGREYPVFRPGRVNVAEQLRIVGVAAAQKVKALVVECMALQPFLQWLTEGKMIRATHGVITNVRADHLDVMGPTERDVALALCGMVPTAGRVFTTESKQLAVIKSVCADRKSTVTAVDRDAIKAVSEQELTGFRYLEHPENVALALAVCADLGVDRQTALEGMQKAAPDPGALREFEIDFFGRKLFFLNGFAANDPQSTETIWNIAWHRFPDVGRRIALINCRLDRPDRSIQLGQACARWRRPDTVVLMGTGTYLFAKAAVDAGLEYGRIHYADDLMVEEIFEIIVELAGHSAVVVGMGNIGGQGLEMVRHFANRSVLRGFS